MSLVDDYFRKRLIDRRNAYKRVTLMVLGKPGLERYGMWSGKIKRFAEEEADEEPRWDESFRAWHDEVIRMRQTLSAD